MIQVSQVHKVDEDHQVDKVLGKRLSETWVLVCAGGSGHSVALVAPYFSIQVSVGHPNVISRRRTSSNAWGDMARNQVGPTFLKQSELLSRIQKSCMELKRVKMDWQWSTWWHLKMSVNCGRMTLGPPATTVVWGPVSADESCVWYVATLPPQRASGSWIGFRLGYQTHQQPPSLVFK